MDCWAYGLISVIGTEWPKDTSGFGCSPIGSEV